MNSTTQNVFLYIVEHYTQYQSSPTFSEIMTKVGINSKGHLTRIIDKLIQSEHLKRTEDKQRNLIPDFTKTPDIKILGRIVAGKPVEAISDEKRINLYSTLFPPGTFALQISGDSMIDAGLYDGDIAIFKPAQFAKNGTIVYALIDGTEATLKRMRVRPDRVILEPCNEQYQAMEYAPERVEIKGIFHKGIAMAR